LDAWFSHLSACVYFGIAINAIAIVLVVLQNLRGWETPLRGALVVTAAHLAAAGFAMAIVGPSPAIWICAAVGIGLAPALARPLTDYSISGRLVFGSLLAHFGVFLAWCTVFVFTIPVSQVTLCLMVGLLAVGVPLSLIGLPVMLPFNSWALRRRWRRPRQPLPPRTEGPFPKVSLHVPCYAEPPEVVKSTLDALARLRYPNFEVLVIDNNTKDPALWRPVEAHCEALGDRFRFFHVAPLAGAKAGALNFALRHTADDAELVALIDADYHAEPDFLERLVGFFDDPRMGFVQTPHDYRAWEESAFLRACYWEYLPHYKHEIAALNEWNAAYTIGTMCILRRRAIEEAGGWAEWCLTEDSEIALRIHALGYDSVFLPQTFGRGLIPETFEQYRKQRFRWTVGPIQQFKRYWRLLLPRPFGAPSELTFMQRMIELSHGLVDMFQLGRVVTLPAMVIVLISLVLNGEAIPVPGVIWVLLACLAPVGALYTWHGYRLLGCRSLLDMWLARWAGRSLMLTRAVGVFAGFLSRKPIAWHRTSKFKALPSGLAALRAAVPELILGAASLLAGLALLPFASFAPPDLVCLASFGLGLNGVSYLAAPALALLADRQLRGAEPAPASEALAGSAAVGLVPVRVTAEAVHGAGSGVSARNHGSTFSGDGARWSQREGWSGEHRSGSEEERKAMIRRRWTKAFGAAALMAALGAVVMLAGPALAGHPEDSSYWGCFESGHTLQVGDCVFNKYGGGTVVADDGSPAGSGSFTLMNEAGCTATIEHAPNGKVTGTVIPGTSGPQTVVCSGEGGGPDHDAPFFPAGVALAVGALAAGGVYLKRRRAG
jgi:glycosyltransferase involved in cell wall biosynthesis